MYSAGTVTPQKIIQLSFKNIYLNTTLHATAHERRRRRNATHSQPTAHDFHKKILRLSTARNATTTHQMIKIQINNNKTTVSKHELFTDQLPYQDLQHVQLTSTKIFTRFCRSRRSRGCAPECVDHRHTQLSEAALVRLCRGSRFAECAEKDSGLPDSSRFECSTIKLRLLSTTSGASTNNFRTTPAALRRAS